MEKWMFGIWMMILSCGAIACSPHYRVIKREQKAMADWSQIHPDQTYLKAHLHNGDLYILRDWEVGESDQVLSGTGVHYNPNREKLSEKEKDQPFQIPFSQIALLETNDLDKGANKEIKALAVMTGISVSITGFCAANPKVCFGSCPTIYGPTNEGYEIMAEGFSASIAPSLEETDVDMLTHLKVSSQEEQLTLHLTNEALETHMIRRMEVWALPRPIQGRTLATPDGAFFQVSEPLDFLQAEVGGTDVLPLLQSLDGHEYSSLANPRTLDSDETIYFLGEVPQAGQYGLVLDKRQSLMTTYLLYQGLAYLGPMASWFLSQVEQDHSEVAELAVPVMERLNGIYLEIEKPEGWKSVRRIQETGPIASDLQLIPLPPQSAGPIRLRLRMNKAMWRLDYCGLVKIGEPVSPQPLRLLAVSDSLGCANPQWKAELTDSAQFLINLPGAFQFLTYQLPPQPHQYDYFLNSQGYYLEWMREEWMAEYNPRLAFRFFRRPDAYLRKIAPAYKAQEAEMETIFWNSRYQQRNHD